MNTEVTMRPTLKLLLLGANIFTPGAETAWPMTGIALSTKVWCTGIPTAVVSWRLKVLIRGSGLVESLPTALPETLTLTGAAAAVIRAEESLETKTAESLVGITPIVGVLLFYVRATKDLIMLPTTDLELWAEDSYGSRVFARKNVGQW